MTRKNRFIVPTRPNSDSIINDNISVIILSSKTNDRMRSYGAKSLIKIPNNETIIQRQINTISQHLPEADIVLVVGYNSEKVIKVCPKWVRIVENPFFDENNSIEELRLGINNIITDRVLVVDGDTIFSNKTIINFPKNKSSVILDNDSMIADDEIGATFQDGIVTNFFYGLDHKYCNIVSLMGKELRHMTSFCSDSDNKNKFIFEGLNYVIERGGKFTVVENEDNNLHKIESSKYLRRLHENSNSDR